jgi:hypothetical protein
MSAVGDIWYRYEDVRCAPMWDEFEHSFGTGRVAVELREYRVVKVTNRGVRLTYAFYGTWSWTRFVLFDSRKRFACATKEEAFASFVRRKQRQVAILTAQLDRAKCALALAETQRA